MGVCFLFSPRGKFNVPVLGCGAVGLQEIHNRYLSFHWFMKCTEKYVSCATSKNQFYSIQYVISYDCILRNEVIIAPPTQKEILRRTNFFGGEIVSFEQMTRNTFSYGKLNEYIGVAAP